MTGTCSNCFLPITTLKMVNPPKCGVSNPTFIPSCALHPFTLSVLSLYYSACKYNAETCLLVLGVFPLLVTLSSAIVATRASKERTYFRLSLIDLRLSRILSLPRKSYINRSYFRNIYISCFLYSFTVCYEVLINSRGNIC